MWGAEQSLEGRLSSLPYPQPVAVRKTCKRLLVFAEAKCSMENRAHQKINKAFENQIKMTLALASL